MIYIQKELNLSHFKLPDYLYFSLFKTTEERIKRWVENNRTRTLLSKNEVINLFSLKKKIQIKEVRKVELKLFDKVIFYNSGEWYVLTVVDFDTMTVVERGKRKFKKL